MNKKQICKTIVFAGILFLLLLMLSYTLRTNGDVKNRFAGFYAEKKNTIDVLMFGASPVGTSFAPAYMWEQYGITSYPLSSNSQRPRAIIHLMEEGFKYQSPKAVVVELRMFAYPDNELAADTPHIREVTDNMRYSWNRFKTIRDMTDQVSEPEYTFHVDLMKYHSNAGILLSPNEWKKCFYSYKDINKGFENPIEWDGAAKAGDADMDAVIAIPKEEEAELRKVCEYLLKKNQKAVFAVAPKTNTTDYQGKMNYMKKIVTEYGFDYLNFNELYDEIGLDFSTDFKEGTHTNISGARKCSDYLGRFLKDTYQLSDKRNDAGYESWDESAKVFEHDYEEVLKRIARGKK